MPDRDIYRDLDSRFRLKYALDRVIACVLVALAGPIFLAIIFMIKLSG